MGIVDAVVPRSGHNVMVTAIYREPAGLEFKGQKLYYSGDHTFAYADFPMDRIIFKADTSGRIAAFNTYWNGLRKGRLWRRVKG